ncbi:hypothetical protein Mal4_36750 [Maioricimonas rarisocia]|uniref:Uncharacterized protein n=1 Tax=Maioricimonas rarisocia TaxID=2528026 RepID=A0A517ZA21_9PLAN|nr:hypothetical protein [Maioricimonas rarisocia]QDU39334.1 hypothetical protein Mal4_36750 [Maioricimonas rarisocia]
MTSVFRQQISRVFRRPREQPHAPRELADVDVMLLPRPVAVAYAARCAREVLPLFGSSWPGASPKVVEGLEHTLCVIEAPEEYVIDDEIARRSVMFLDQVVTSSTHAPAASRAARVIQATYSATHASQVRELAPATHELVMHAVRFTDEAVRCCNRPDDEKQQIVAALCDDFFRLHAFANSREIEDSDACSVRMLRRWGVLE